MIAHAGTTFNNLGPKPASNAPWPSDLTMSL